MKALIALVLIAVSLVPQVVFLLRRGSRADPLSHYMLLAAALLLFATIIVRSIQISFPAVTNTYEAMVFFSAAICLVLFILRAVSKNPPILRFSIFGGTIVALALIMISSSPLVPKAIQPPIPALRSLWLVLHVTLAFIGEAFFAVAFVAAINYLLSKDEGRRGEIDRIMYTTIIIGYPIFTLGALIFGAIWAEAAWGSYWSWDPKETWALITWLVYTAFLHSRLVMKLKGRISAIFSIAGFLFTIFTFAGVNYLLSGLHSYGQ
jgi:ABC-type transport system involved in cytochrome c biogenesis permease subunit